MFRKRVLFIRNLTPKTISTYEQAWKVYLRYSIEINQTNLNRFVISMREAGNSPGGCNSYIRSINSFFSWPHENGHLTDRLHIKACATEIAGELAERLAEVQYRDSCFFAEQRTLEGKRAP